MNSTQENKKTVLIVEDEPDIAFAISMFLEEEGYRTLTAENGQKALDALKEEGLPSLILLDMKMPVMNGWQFASEFIAAHDHKTPILVMTAAADAEARAKDVQANQWIGKPFDLDTLYDKIRELI